VTSALFPRRETTPHELRRATRQALEASGWRFGHVTARRAAGNRLLVEALLLDTRGGGGLILSAPLGWGEREYASLTPQIPAAHWAERALGDLFGIRAVGHPRWKPLLLHESWPAGLAPLRREPAGDDAAGRGELAPAATADPVDAPYRFMEVAGEGVHEIPVGPIHAGIIEPGHFRFSCLGEVITNLEIRLGYQHRGVERRLTEAPWTQARFVAEAASSDTAAGNALAHAIALEQILGIAAPPRAEALRTIALEVERVASHLGDLGGLSADIGYSAGAAIFSRLRGAALGLGEQLAGNRLQRGYIVPGGVARDLPDSRRSDFAGSARELAGQVTGNLPFVLEHPAVIERMEETGRLSPSLARAFGLVGPAARASGSRYDARTVFRHGVYPEHAPPPARREAGDVLARAQVRAEELTASLDLLVRLAESLPASGVSVPVTGPLPPDAVGVSIVEAWRGELIHWVTTGPEGSIQRYAIKDPSFNNWTGLAIAVRGNLVGDFPLCNKSFNLSYSGNDL
jgi:Ni,Fe-hydrogenase III large subunit/Ni,Fe-hydrogenase III component G